MGRLAVAQARNNEKLNQGSGSGNGEKSQMEKIEDQTDMLQLAAQWRGEERGIN